MRLLDDKDGLSCNLSVAQQIANNMADLAQVIDNLSEEIDYNSERNRRAVNGIRAACLAMTTTLDVLAADLDELDRGERTAAQSRAAAAA